MMNRTEIGAGARPCVVVAHSDPAYAAAASRGFWEQGWHVSLARSAADVRRLTGLRTPAAVVLDTELPDESGWLTCAKLRGERPGLKVVVVGNEPTEVSHAFAAFVGAAALLDRADGATALVDEVAGTALPVAG